MSKHALIGGGTGFIGKALVNHLRRNNYNVTIISRMPGTQRITWHQLEEQGIPAGVSAVINVTGQNVLDPTKRWSPGFQQNVWNSRVNTTKALAKAIEKSAGEVKSFVSVSGVSHYPPDNERSYDEHSSTKCFDYMSRLCLAWEQAAKPSDEQASKSCQTTILRTGVVVGRGGGMIGSIWLPFILGVGGPLGTGRQFMPWIHLDDWCRLALHIVEDKAKQGESIVNAVAPEITTNGAFSKQFARALRRPCMFAVPEFTVKLIFGRDRSALLLSGAKVVPKAALASGFKFKYPTVQQAVHEIVQKR